MGRQSKKFDPWVAEKPSFIGGGQGDLYLVRHSAGTPPGEFVLKRLKNPKRHARFERELKSLIAVAGHPNIVGLIDPGAYTDGARGFYVMEMADGSLASEAPREGYDPTRAIGVFRDVLAGVKALHDAGIVHRDIKPDNILLFGTVAKVADTGLCLIVSDDRLTPTYEAVGPRFYMAPELEHGRNLDVSARADIYSLGKLLYWLLSGGVILPRERFADKDYTLWRVRAPGLEAFRPLFEKTLTTNPKSRFASVDQLIASFDTAVENYLDHADTRLENKFAGGRRFRTVFPKLQIDEKAAAIKRAELGLLELSSDDLIFMAERDRGWRNARLLSLLSPRIEPSDARVKPLALKFAESEKGLDALCPLIGPKPLIAAMLQAIIAHGSEEQVEQLVSSSATPFLEFDDLIAAILARYPVPASLPAKLLPTMAVFPRLADNPDFIEVVIRAFSNPPLDEETTQLAAFALAKSTDPRAAALLDQLFDIVRAQGEDLKQLSAALVIGPVGIAKLKSLASDPKTDDEDRSIFALLLDVSTRELGRSDATDADAKN